MGCGKSKIKRISLTPDNLNEDQLRNGIDTISGKVNGEINRPKSSGLELGHNGIIPGETRSKKKKTIPFYQIVYFFLLFQYPILETR